MIGKFSRWLFMRTHKRVLEEIRHDSNHALGLGKAKRDGMYIALRHIGLW